MFHLILSHSPRYRSKARNVINYRQVEKKILDEILGVSVYDTRLRPPGQNKSMTATLVYVNIFVRDFSAISDVTMVGRQCLVNLNNSHSGYKLKEYDFSITLRQRWNDARLIFQDKLQIGMEGESCQHSNSLKSIS